MEWLWVGKNNPQKTIPWDLLELQLCRDVYHCTPSELASQDWDQIQRHLIVMSAEAEVEKFVSGK